MTGCFDLLLPQFRDNNDGLLSSRIYFYELSGLSTHAPDRPSSVDRFTLEQNYPNPFNPTTVISYQLSETSDVEVTIYNQLGQEVRTLIKERKTAGAYQIEWDGRDHTGKQAASGVYLYHLKAGSYVETRKLVLLR